MNDHVDQRLKEIRRQAVEVGDLLRRIQMREMRDQRRQNISGIFQIDQIEGWRDQNQLFHRKHRGDPAGDHAAHRKSAQDDLTLF